MMDSLEEYLTKRGLFEPTKVIKAVMSGQKEVPVGDEILNDSDMLAKVAGMWQSNQPVLEAVIRARIYPILVDLTMSAFPQETIVLRQSILELAEVLNDFKRYNDEHIRREQTKDNK